MGTMTKAIVKLHFVPIVLKKDACHDATELTGNELRIVVALIAARRVGRLGATVAELAEVTGLHTSMIKLERELWVVKVARIERSNSHVYAPTPRAAARLWLNGWVPMLFTDEQIERIDPTLPRGITTLETPVDAFLVEVARTVSLVGPEIVSTTGEAVEERAAS